MTTGHEGEVPGFGTAVTQGNHTMRARRPLADRSLRSGLRLRGGSALPAGMGKAFLECARSRQVKRRAGRLPRPGGHPPVRHGSEREEDVRPPDTPEACKPPERGSSGTVEEAGSQIRHCVEGREEMLLGGVVGEGTGEEAGQRRRYQGSA